ncbi:beta-Ig-H3/fasciclin [Gloeothece citriformis PCC 7424]|uniref:Beta-Ig-H3/fasciclin n=1 Tax=Gloeothece citriformis (strain PCC 7424) TaxID=65393 RepID=B7K6R2_GLOC7|nr:fasciclin domain-containing protein [Gloeothece citriformis]ACK72611.1 beta-Ig-H3/fasciclin [Gloeothece citriformis PCC 7424]
MSDIIENLKQAKNLSRFLEGLELTRLTETLHTQETYTIFAPVNEAFINIPDQTLKALFESLPLLKRVMTYHIGFGDIRKEDLLQIDEVTTMEGSVIAVEKSSDQIRLNNANLLTSDIISDNGVIHLIDQVLIPTLVLQE